MFAFVKVSKSELNTFVYSFIFVIRLEAMLQPNIGFTLPYILVVFMRSAITPPKVNRFG